jgi:uncharacterized protein YuzB (UPF0349 family)
MPTSVRVVEYVKKCENKLKEGGDQTCRICNVTKSIELFERPFLTMCKSCAADKSPKTVECDVCHKIVKYGNYSKHKKTKRCLAFLEEVILDKSVDDQNVEEVSEGHEANCEAKFRSVSP